MGYKEVIVLIRLYLNGRLTEVAELNATKLPAKIMVPRDDTFSNNLRTMPLKILEMRPENKILETLQSCNSERQRLMIVAIRHKCFMNNI